MQVSKLALLAVGLCLAGLLLGCGGSFIQPPPLAITTTSPLPQGNTGTAYSTTLSAKGGVQPYTWSASGNIPPGLSLSAAGVLSGTPTTIGTFVFTVQVTDSAHPPVVASGQFSLSIVTPP